MQISLTILNMASLQNLASAISQADGSTQLSHPKRTALHSPAPPTRKKSYALRPLK